MTSQIIEQLSLKGHVVNVISHWQQKQNGKIFARNIFLCLMISNGLRKRMSRMHAI